jgi:hypothetical protein
VEVLTTLADLARQRSWRHFERGPQAQRLQWDEYSCLWQSNLRLGCGAPA